MQHLIKCNSSIGDDLNLNVNIKISHRELGKLRKFSILNSSNSEGTALIQDVSDILKSMIKEIIDNQKIKKVYFEQSKILDGFAKIEFNNNYIAILVFNVTV